VLSEDSGFESVLPIEIAKVNFIGIFVFLKPYRNICIAQLNSRYGQSVISGSHHIGGLIRYGPGDAALSKSEKMTVFWNVVPYSVVEVYPTFQTWLLRPVV
jgi:hypothetical protein